jgi:hypothetical protein
MDAGLPRSSQLREEWGNHSLIRKLRWLALEAYREIRAAAAIDPDATAIEAPGGALYARRAAALVYHSYATACIHRTEIAPSIVGGTRNGVHRPSASSTDRRTVHAVPYTYDEVCAAAAIDPDSAAVESIGGALYAGRAAPLIHHPHATAGIHRAQMTPAIVGGACDAASALIRNAALRPQLGTGATESNENYGEEKSF